MIASPESRNTSAPPRAERLRRANRRVAAGIAVVGIAFTAAFASTTASAAPIVGSAVKASSGLSTPVSYDDGSYIITLVDEPAATYRGTDARFAATAPKEGRQLEAAKSAVQAYVAHLESRHADVAASVDAEVGYDYTLTLNGFSAVLTGEQASELATRKDVAAVTKSEVRHLDRASTAAAAAVQPVPDTGQVRSTDFLGLEGPDGVWARLGGIENAGKGIVIGDIDSGIAPENPSFAGDPLGTKAGAAPYLDGDTITFEKADGQTYTGTCQAGLDADQQWTGDECNTKLVGAQWFLPQAIYPYVGTPDRPEYLSPRDGDGHGSHTSSTAGGNAGVDAVVDGYDYGQISGVAPAAKIAEYKVCWNGNGVQTDDGCYSESLLAAIDQAVADGVDVINYSIGGGSATSTFTLEDEAFLGAAAAGVFVSASAGNSGPGVSTLDHASPWYATVAAASIPTYTATAELGDGQKFAGASISVHADVTGPLVTSESVAGKNGDAKICEADSLDPKLAEGTIVVCEAGVTARVSKSAEVARAGGIGMLLVNPVTNAIHADDHAVPSIQIDADAYGAIYDYAANSGATATLVSGNTSGVERPQPQVAGFSSRGPAEADGTDVLKPDITGPGVSILADGANAQGEEPTFQFESGTSMSAPHIAGLAALYLGVDPTASPSTIKSAMMTTASDTKNPDGTASSDVFAQGAGQVDPSRMFEPGLVYESGIEDWIAFLEGEGYVFTNPTGIDPIDPSELNLPSISIGALAGTQTVTRTVTATAAGDYTAALDIPGVDTVVTPSTLNFGAAGETQSYTVTFTNVDATLAEFATGYLSWTSGAADVVRSPVAVRPVLLDAPYEVSATGAAGSTPVAITSGIDGVLPLTSAGLARGELLRDDSAANGHSGTLPVGEQFVTDVTVAAGARFARFDLDALDDAGDLDLYVDLLGDDGEPAASYLSATGSADERVDISEPEPGTYRVTADIYAASGSASTATFDLRDFVVTDDGGLGGLATDPAGLPVALGQPAAYSATWTGLSGPARYLGVVDYADSGLFTLVSVDVTTASTPTPTPTPTATTTAGPTAPPVPSPTVTSTATTAPTAPPGAGGGSGALPGTGWNGGLFGALALAAIGAGVAITGLRRRTQAQRTGE